MNWDDMRVFLALARAGTLVAAARQASLDATTIARRLQRLEGILGTVLFEHGPSGHVLTEAGERLLADAEAMESAARQIQRTRESNKGLSGVIRVSASEGFGTWFIASRLAKFTSDHPGIAVDLIASTGFLNPSRREADIAVMLARPHGGPLIASKLTDYRLGAYASDQYLAENGPIGAISDLRDQRLVGYVPDLIYAPELRYLAEVDERLDASLRSSSIIAQARLIGAGGGCGILPCFIGEAMPCLRRVLRDDVTIERQFWLVVHRDMRRVARVDAFIHWLRDETARAQGLLFGIDPGSVPR